MYCVQQQVPVKQEPTELNEKEQEEKELAPQDKSDVCIWILICASIGSIIKTWYTKHARHVFTLNIVTVQICVACLLSRFYYTEPG